MFELQLYIVIIIVALCLLYRILPCKFYEILVFIGTIFVAGLEIYLLIHFRIMQIIGFGVLATLLATIIAMFIDSKKNKDANCFMGLLYILPVIAFTFLINRGFTTRVYDISGVLSFAEEYNINQNLKYNGRLDSTTNSDHNNVYMIAARIGEDKDKLEKYKDKFKKKAEYSNYYIVILWYDEDGEFSHSGYSYSFLWDTMNYADSVTSYIDKVVDSDGLEKSVEDITENIDKAISTYENPFEDNGWGEDASDLGVHWVDGYTRGDGTEVDGYLRTDPDGDVTNNFSYYD